MQALRALRHMLHAYLLRGQAVRLPFQQRYHLTIPGDAHMFETTAVQVYAFTPAGDAMLDIGALTIDPRTLDVAVTFVAPQSGVLYLVPAPERSVTNDST